MPAADQVEDIGRSIIGRDGTEPASGLAVSQEQSDISLDLIIMGDRS